MGITIHRSFGSLEHLELVTAEDMREIGLLERERIIRRTISGRDANGAPFAPYSAGYATQKQRALGGAAVVNLQVSGSMLNDIQVVNVQGWPEPFVELGFSK